MKNAWDSDTIHLNPGEPFMHTSDLLTRSEALEELRHMGHSDQMIADLFAQAQSPINDQGGFSMNEIGPRIKTASTRPLARVRLGAASMLPALFTPSETSAKRFREFSTVNIRDRNRPRAYFDAVSRFAAWCDAKGLHDLLDIEPVHVASFIEELGRTHWKPTVKQHLAAARMLFDWLVTGQIVAHNPAHAVRGPKHSVRKGKTSVLTADEMRDLLASIDTSTLIGLRECPLIALTGYTFARLGAAVGMKVEDF